MKSNLLDILTSELEIVDNEKSKTLEDALEKALENTTPTHAGVPWEKKCQENGR